MNKQEGKKKRYKAWYYSMAVCVVACFIAAFGIFGSSPTSDATSDIDIVSTKSNEEREVAAKAENVPDTRETTTKAPKATTQASEPEEESTTEAANDFSENVPFESKFILPSGTEILNDYSDGQFIYSETSGDYRIHNGIDFSAEEGSAISAIISGEVTAIINDPHYGTIVEVNHGNKLLARYCGVANAAVSQGTIVKQGDKIGEITTIPIEGDKPHLHFETLIDGIAEDPLAVMSKAG